jgi:hypothetical protein
LPRFEETKAPVDTWIILGVLSPAAAVPMGDDVTGRFE